MYWATLAGKHIAWGLTGLMVPAACAALAGCQTDDRSNIAAAGSTAPAVLSRSEIDLTILDHDVSCVGAHGPRRCLLVQEGDAEIAQLYYGQIIGYAPQGAGPITLRVIREILDPADVPADAGAIRDVFVAVITP